MIKFLQINVNRSRPAHDMALATSKNLGVGILIISEPNRNALRGRKDWFYDADLNTAIKIIDPNITIKDQGHGNGFSFVTTKDFTIYSCYSSGNDEIEDLESMLDEIGGQIRSTNKRSIIAGDFNAKSPQWGMTITDRRGQLMNEWVAENDFVVVNQGEKPTFVRRDYGSILDLTIVTENIRSSITQWEVLNEESLSDHNYVFFGIQEESRSPISINRECGWQVKKLDKDKLQSTLADLNYDDSEISAREFSQSLKHICDKVMPKRRLNPPRKPVYWWCEEIAQLRRECIQNRRAYTRNAPRAVQHLRNELHEIYKESQKRLKNRIKKAKRDCWKSLCQEVDNDIWGEGYKIVMKSIIGYPPRVNLTMETMQQVVDQLFPRHNEVVFNCDNSARFVDFTEEELNLACDKLKNNKAPGPGCIPPEIIKLISINKPAYVLSTYNKLGRERNFPADWKRAKLLLLKKGDKPQGSPSSFRPICLLDVEGKLYEHLLLGRLNAELSRMGNLSDKQFGFRKGKQTVDAINVVLNIAKEEEAQPWSRRQLCAMITLDVKNAFNSASWQFILEELRSRQIDESLISIIASYLSNRHILLEAANSKRAIKINSGVPQGSILGPTLWNILYDKLFDLDMPEDVTLVGFADDVAMVVKARNETLLMDKANTSLLRVSKWMKRRNLMLAPEKTEAVLLTKKRKMQRIHFFLQGTEVDISPAIKYLGIWLDTKLSFAKHVNETINKAQRTTTALLGLMPNIGGPRSSKRRILASVVHSQLLYASPAWHSVIGNKKLLQRLARVQKTLSIRICSAYKTISAEAVGVIAGIPPIEFLIQERKERYSGDSRLVARNHLMARWKEKWDSGRYGRWTHSLIPDIERWVDRPYGENDYFLTQALSGHGCFRKYLFDRGKVDSSNCTYCHQEDDANHTLFYCKRWNCIRQDFTSKTGEPFTMVNMMEYLLRDKESWITAHTAIGKIIKTKELESRNQS